MKPLPSMKAFTGQARLHIGTHDVHVSISLNPMAGSFEAEMLADAIPDGVLENSAGEAKLVRLTDVSIPLPTGTLRCHALEDIYLAGDDGRTSSVFETPISMALNLAGDRSGTRRISLSPKAHLLSFSHTPAFKSLCELYFLNNFIKFNPISITIAGNEVQFFPREASLSVTGAVDLRPLLHRIRAAWSILQGAHLSHAASYTEDGGVDLAVRQPRAYNKGRTFVRGWENLTPLLSAVVASFASMSDDEFKGWEKAISFYLEGRNSELDYDVRIIGFMIFIEMFDGSLTMSKQAISQQFSCSMELADFLVRIRNKLIHNRMSLWNAVPQVHSELIQYQSLWRCPEIDFTTGDYENASILFFHHLERLVNAFIVNHIGYQGKFDDNSDIIAGLESKWLTRKRR